MHFTCLENGSELTSIDDDVNWIILGEKGDRAPNRLKSLLNMTPIVNFGSFQSHMA